MHFIELVGRAASVRRHPFVVGSLLSVFVGSSALLGCSSSTSTAGSTPSGSDAGEADATPDSTEVTCATFGGTCVDGTTPTPSCGAGLFIVHGGALCGGGLQVCCAPGSAGSRVVKGDTGLLCTTSGFSEFGPGTCGDASCAVGGECNASSNGATCDLSRGLPVTKDGTVECAAFSCGSIACGVGCTCKDPQTSACTCP